MAAREQPFGENEVRYFLAEILKNSSIAPFDLMAFIQERGIQPSWYDIALPNGRSLNSCMGVWHHLQANVQARFTAPVQPMVTFEQPSPQNASKAKKKRPASGENVPAAVDRVLQPQLPLNFPPVNSPSVPATDQAMRVTFLGGPSKKKRGRPSKVEYEAKVAEAAARGEEYHPTPKRKKAQRTSLQSAPHASMVAPGMTEVETTGAGSADRNNARNLKGAPGEAIAPAPETTAPSLTFEATALAADQMQIDQRKPFKSTIPETQASEIDPRGGPLADVRDNAEPTTRDTVQSSMTLQHDSTPQNYFASYQSPSRDPVTAGEQRVL